MFKRHSVKKILCSIFAVFVMVSMQNLEAFGIAGGQQQTNLSYEALVSQTGVATPMTGAIPSSGNELIYSVSINGLDYSIIGGEDGNLPFVALVDPSGLATPLTGATPTGNGAIGSVDINNLNRSIIGGYHNTSVPYAALVSPSGVATVITPSPAANGAIRSVSINDSGNAIIGGRQNGGGAFSSDPYAAIVSSSGVASIVSGATPASPGDIWSVAINSSGQGIIGGWNTNGFLPYAAVVSPGGVATAISGDVPVSSGVIESVAINDSGVAIIGGAHNGQNEHYAAFVSPSGVATLITGLPNNKGEISAVDINSSGNAIIGGNHFTFSLTYIALVSSSGAVVPISGDFPQFNGTIRSVAINDAGVAMAGGDHVDSQTPYLVLIAPNGVATNIVGYAPIAPGSIYSVDLSDDTIVPPTIGSGGSYVDALFPLSTQVLPNHHRALYGYSDNCPCPGGQPNTPHMSCRDKTEYVIWLAPFGSYAHNKKQQNFPSITNWIGGAMVGFDYRGIESAVVGVGVAYAFDRANYGENRGHARVHEEFLALYGSWEGNHILIESALWGGFYQMHNKRNTLGFIRSKSHINGWLFNPHIEVSSPFYVKEDWIMLSPFVMFDFANNWQGKIRETGKSGLNIRIGRAYTSMLRTEVGLKIYETLKFNWGNVVFEQKGSYANKKPFHTSSKSAHFAGSPATFDVGLFPGKTQNLGIIQVSSQIIPCRNKYPYGSMSYQGEFGSKFQSHTLVFEVGKRF